MMNVIKFNALGTEEWNNTFTGAGGSSRGLSLVEAWDG